TGALPFPSKGPQAMLQRMTGRLEPLAAVHPEVRWPAALQRCLDRALALDPADRPATADAFAEELGRVVDAWWSGADREVSAGIVALPRAAEAGPASARKVGLLGRLWRKPPPAGGERERDA